MKAQFLQAVFVLCLTGSQLFAEPVVIRIDGSNGMIPLVESLVEPFESANPSYKVAMGKGWSSKTRLQALADDKMDIAMASHGLKPDVLKALKQTPHLFAKMAVVFAVHDSVGVRDLTADQLAAIYRGDYTNWKQVGGTDLKIIRLMRPEDEVDAEVIREVLPSFTNLKWADDTKIIKSSGDLAAALNATPGAIGVTTLVRAEKGDKTNALSISGVAPTEENVLAERYLLTRGSYLVTPVEPSLKVRAFLGFLNTEKGRAVIRKSNSIPWSHSGR